MSRPTIEQILAFLALGGVFALAASEVHSFDIFWQLQSGKYVLETQSFIYRDIFSLAANAPRFEHCWLHDIIFYLVWLAGGYAGISLLKGGIVLAAGAAAYVVARRLGASWLSILYIAPPALIWTRTGWLERPQLWTFLFFVLFLLVLENYRKHRSLAIYGLIPLVIVWSNLHAAAILAFPVVFAYLVGEGLEKLIRRSTMTNREYLHILGVFLLLFVGVLVNPYGVEYLDQLLRAPSFGESSGNIKQLYNMDWRPIDLTRDIYFFYSMAAAGCLLLLGWRRFSVSQFCLFAGLAIMGLKLQRHTPFFLLAGAAILPVYLDAAVRPVVRWVADRRKVFMSLKTAAILGAIALFFSFAQPAYRVYGAFDLGLREWHYPVEATEFVKENNLPSNIYNTYDWGGYLMWTLYPDYLVFWDGRSDSEEMFAKGISVMSGSSRWQKILNQHGVNTIITKACTVDTGQRYPFLDRLQVSRDWALVFADESSMVFVRNSAVPGPWLQRHALPKSRIDDTILSEAQLLLSVDSSRIEAYWEMARVLRKKGDLYNAWRALDIYLKRTPRPNPHAVRAYQSLKPRVRAQQ